MTENRRNKKTLARVLQRQLNLPRQAELAKALRCSRMTVYRWLEDDPKPGTLTHEILEYMNEQAGKKSCNRELWGERLRDADTIEKWLRVVLLPPRVPGRRRKRRPLSLEDRVRLVGQIQTVIDEERARLRTARRRANPPEKG